MSNVPELWWSPRHGLITRTEDVDGEQVYRHLLDHRVSLRHIGLPNELPADAVALRPVVEDDETVERLAKAIFRRRLTPDEPYGDWDATYGTWKEMARDDARAALRALREDTDA